MTATAEISFTDENFQSQHSAKCDLLIKVSEGNFSYAVVDQIQDQVKILFSCAFKEGSRDLLRKQFSENPVFNFNFRKVKLAGQTSCFTFIPEQAFEHTKMNQYAAFTASEGQQEIASAPIRQAGIQSIFSLEHGIRDVLLEKFTGAVLFSQAEPFIESALKIYPKPIAEQVFIQFNGSTFELLIIVGKKVRFYNVFANSTADEFNYFLLFVINQLKIDSQNTAIILSGEVSEGDDRCGRIHKYFADVQFADSSKLIRIPEPIRQHSHRFFSLLSLNTCA